MTPTSHSVIFYERDDSLLAPLAAFAAEGLDAGERVIVIATPQHIAALVNALGEGPGRRAPHNDLVLLYAGDALKRIAPSGVVERARLFDWMGPLVTGGRCRVFGEMVSLLAERGQLEEAFELEAAGDELAHEFGVAVLCAYDLRHLAGIGPDVRDRIVARHDDLVSAAATAPRRRPCVLIAEDFEDAREMYAEYLQYADVRVVTAADGEEAVRRAREHSPDLILMDVRMPGLTGTEAMRVLRQEDRFRRIPILALIAHALDNERAAMLADGFDGVIAKPCLPDRLVAEVRARLDVPSL